MSDSHKTAARFAELHLDIAELKEVLSYIADDATIDFAKECVRLRKQLNAVRGLQRYTKNPMGAGYIPTKDGSLIMFTDIEQALGENDEL